MITITQIIRPAINADSPFDGQRNLSADAALEKGREGFEV
jgi:hypothetical protein